MRHFSRWAAAERIEDDALCEVVERAEKGLVAADLGSGLFKARVARQGQGRRGGYRVLLGFRSEVRTIFLYGFAKNERDNIPKADLADWKRRAGEVLNASNAAIEAAIANETMGEIDRGN